VPIVDQVDIRNCTAPECNPCISPIPDICYKIVTYEIIKELAPSLNGYTISYQRCCRIDVLANVQSVGDNVGDTWTIGIPGTKKLASGPQNSSPVFPTNDTTIVCAHNFFIFKFDATDSDGDSLSYSFAPAYDGTPPPNPPNPTTATNPPYNVVPYTSPFSAFQPLGSAVTINPSDGLISGIAPDIGEYVIAVLVTEYRNGIAFAYSRKSLHVQVSSCNPLIANLNPVYTFCGSYTGAFSNNGTNPPGATYHWDFGVPNKTNDTSNLANPSFTYPDTGLYKLSLEISLNGKCFDSTTSIVKVYPGFFPAFSFTGQCANTQIQFTDKTTTTYGAVNSWAWNFGDAANSADTSHLQNPKYSYPVAGNYTVNLLVTSNKGCSDTVSAVVPIKDKPALSITNDTLICSIDTLQLNATGAGTVLWTPNYNINNQTNPSPLVSPDVPTKYYVTLTDPSGCKANDSVFVDVKLVVTLDAGRDTGICAGDAIQLNPISDALHYKWTPAAFLNNDTAKYPIAMPVVTTTFYVIGNIGKCQSTDSVKVRVALYPGAGGVPDTTICVGKSVQFNETGGSSYTWSPTFFLNNPNIANPIANPDRSIRYIVTITDTLGCPKPVFDTVVVIVQNVTADAGPRDTSIVINQPLQLNATGGQFYLWTPATGLNNNAIANPVALLNDNIQYVVAVSTGAGCFATDTINVTVYKVLPGIYVPNGFTPNGDGKNDVFRPIPIGIKQINYFKVYNRWGVLVYSSNKTVYEQGEGWDGTFKGKPQDAAVFVWIAEGVDYQDKKITQKGTVTLIR
jgi:gliding motility-associated-like protein